MSETSWDTTACCGCRVKVRVVVEPLSRDEVERDCWPNDPEVPAVGGAEIVGPCGLHGGYLMADMGRAEGL